MAAQTPNDNKYDVGTIIFAKTNPQLALTINKYYKRIYYCGVASQPDRYQFAYFERELVPPARLIL